MGAELIEVPTAAKVLPPALTAGARPLAIVPTDLDQVWRLATMIHKAGMAPKDMDTPEKISVALMHGLEIGLKPMQAMQRIAVINGRPAIWGDAVIGLVRGSGLAEYIDEELIGEGDHMVAVCKTKRKGEKKEIERTFSVADAKKAGLWDTREKVRRRGRNNESYEANNDSPWYRFPKRMLQMRARVALRDGYADVLGGMYIAEELIEGYTAEPDAQNVKDVTPRKAAAKDLPPAIEQRQPDPVSDEIEQPEQQVSEPVARTGKPLPPLARAARAMPVREEAAASDQPPAPPPANQKENAGAVQVASGPTPVAAGATTSATSDFPGDKPMKSSDDGLDIPPYLKRDAKPAAETFNVEEWLKSLENALSGCESTEQLATAQATYQTPYRGKVGKADWARSQTMVMDAFTRISKDD
jgi:RecT family